MSMSSKVVELNKMFADREYFQKHPDKLKEHRIPNILNGSMTSNKGHDVGIKMINAKTNAGNADSSKSRINV